MATTSTDDRGIESVLLPRGVAGDRDREGAVAIVTGCEHASGERLHAKRREVVARDELPRERFGRAGIGSTHAETRTQRVGRRELLERRDMVADLDTIFWSPE